MNTTWADPVRRKFKQVCYSAQENSWKHSILSVFIFSIVSPVYNLVPDLLFKRTLALGFSEILNKSNFSCAAPESADTVKRCSSEHTHDWQSHFISAPLTNTLLK